MEAKIQPALHLLCALAQASIHWKGAYLFQVGIKGIKLVVALARQRSQDINPPFLWPPSLD